MIHHELCFGCGRTNLFGLLVELEASGVGAVSGRCFIKQDHQGSRPGEAHEGIIATALSEAMAFAHGTPGAVRTFELVFTAPAPVGSFLELAARVDRREPGIAHTSGSAQLEGRPVASARATYDETDG